jgi:hypothetical protein
MRVIFTEGGEESERGTVTLPQERIRGSVKSIKQ